MESARNRMRVNFSVGLAFQRWWTLWELKALKSGAMVAEYLPVRYDKNILFLKGC